MLMKRSPLDPVSRDPEEVPSFEMKDLAIVAGLFLFALLMIVLWIEMN